MDNAVPLAYLYDLFKAKHPRFRRHLQYLGHARMLRILEYRRPPSLTA
jgi:hypothetical protein